jgi:putative ABC transport system ATP-binding protein
LFFGSLKAMISAHNITLTYHSEGEDVTALTAVNLELPSTGLIGIIGPSGSGKTSLLYVLAGIRPPSSGEVHYNGTAFPKKSRALSELRRKNMGFVFQYHFLISYLTTLENVLVGASATDKAATQRAHQLLKEVGLEGYEQRLPHELSGGQRQRVAIARALVNQPSILFVDEPTASLDKATAQYVIELLQEVSKQVCTVVVTHDPAVIKEARVVYQLHNGELQKS